LQPRSFLAANILVTALIASTSIPIFAQESSGGGASTGGSHAAIHDAQDRPITAGGFVDSGPVIFQDVSKQAGLTIWHHTMGTRQKQFIIETNGSGVGLIDYDNDGWLDIYLVNGSTYDAEQGKTRPPQAALFHNNHDGTFTNVAEKAGVTNKRWGFGVAIGDFDNDGWPDIYVSNFGKNRLYRNNHDGTFTDVAEKSGVTLGNWSTGATFGDYENNGLLDILTTDFSDDYKVLYHNDGDANFSDVSYHMGIAQEGIPFLGWGVGFMDYDNDGWKDIMMINGHVYPAVDRYDWGSTFAERPLLFHNMQGKHFDYVPPVKGSGLAVVVPGRGAAFGDLFNDGKIDAVINVIDAAPVLLRNVSKDGNHWVELKLVGGPKGPRDAVGATVYLTANGMRQRDDVISGGSYMSSNDQRVHFGLGQATKVDEVEIQWPGGAKEKLQLPAVDRIFTIEEGKGITGTLCTQCNSKSTMAKGK